MLHVLLQFKTKTKYFELTRRKVQFKVVPNTTGR